ncbi:hypothetical protein GOBAR_DD26339 [Gossypium barbadense]|nr:hypothetical protein GOBAR_DD26339 [Gossypium barbadense]
MGCATTYQCVGQDYSGQSVVYTPFSSCPCRLYGVGSEPSKDYTVCIGYRLLTTSDFTENINPYQPIYNKLWKMQLLSYLLEFYVVHAKFPGCLIRIECWQPPEGSCLIVNFDATFHTSMMLSCARIVVTNKLGFVVGSKSVVNTHIPSTFAAEVLACYHVVQLGLNLGLQKVRFSEADSHAVSVHGGKDLD